MNKLVEALKAPQELTQGRGFYAFWSVYPKRKGTNPRALAEKKYLAAIKAGADPEHLISSAKRYADELREQGMIDTPFVCYASTWLNQKRWLDYAPDPASKERESALDADMAKRGYRWNGERWVEVKDTKMFLYKKA